MGSSLPQLSGPRASLAAALLVLAAVALAAVLIRGLFAVAGMHEYMDGTTIEPVRVTVQPGPSGK